MGHQDTIYGIKGLWFWDHGHCIWDARSLGLGCKVSMYGIWFQVPIYGILLALLFVRLAYLVTCYGICTKDTSAEFG